MAQTKSQKTAEKQRRIPRQARSRQKVEAVLDACTQVLSRSGYHQTSVLELSLESGVPVPTLYQYFTNKEAIFVAWMDRSVDQILQLVATQQDRMPGASVAQYADILVRLALQSIEQLRPSIVRLLTDLPQVLSARLVMIVELKTVVMLEQQFAAEIAQRNDPEFIFKLRMLVRLITGYFLQAVMNDQRELEVEREAQEIAMLVKLYLMDAGASVAD